MHRRPRSGRKGAGCGRQVGCGRSFLASGSRAPAPGSGAALALLAGQLAAVRASLDAPRVHVLAHGWGAALALEHALSGGGAGIASLTLASAPLSAAQLAADRRARVRRSAAPFPGRRALAWPAAAPPTRCV
jgi:pimeloyl-ACP methyl ester carboxylesterase